MKHQTYQDKKWLAIQYAKDCGFKPGRYAHLVECKRCGKEYDWHSGLKITRHQMDHQHKDKQNGTPRQQRRIALRDHVLNHSSVCDLVDSLIT